MNKNKTEAIKVVKTPTKETPKKRQTFKYAGVDLEIIDSKDSLVPQTALEVNFSEADKKAIAIAVKENMACLLVGETGTGKTSLVRQLAFLRKQPFVRVNMTGFTTPDELIGTKSVKNGETYFEHGIITDAMKRGAILDIDEINATMPDCLFILHGLLDDDRRITLPNGEVIYPHPDFRVFATCNPDYEGTRTMNRAFMDRFPVVIGVETLDVEDEEKLLISRLKLEPELAKDLVTIATLARKDYAENKIMSFVSTRALLHVGQLIQSGLKAKDAYTASVVKKTNNQDEQKILSDIFGAVFKASTAASQREKIMLIKKKDIDDLNDKLTALKADVVKVAEKDRELVTRNTQLLDEVAKLKQQLTEVKAIPAQTFTGDYESLLAKFKPIVKDIEDRANKEKTIKTTLKEEAKVGVPF